MHNSLSMKVNNVTKKFRLYGSKADQLIDALGLTRIGFKHRHAAPEFVALDNISFEVPRGHRIGIVGRNGAGKTTLLKLICGNFRPTAGSIEVNGTVQALMSVGLGFHPEYTGRENIESSLQYNGLDKNEYQLAIEEIIDFCELGEFIDQPFKTYSLGMQARLMFASATAIKPDILIVDEVLGAGDAYFVAKSKSRVEKLIKSGCTMLLVSHSMQQVLELCDEAIWLDKGKIRMQGDAFKVVKAYEEYLHGPINNIEHSDNLAEHNVHSASAKSHQDSGILENKRGEVIVGEIDRQLDLPSNILFQQPAFIPHAIAPQFPHYNDDELDGFSFLASGGLSRWDADKGLKLCGFSIVTERGISNKLVSMRPAKIVLTLVAEEIGAYSCIYGLLINDHMGSNVVRIYSPTDNFEMHQVGEKRCVEMLLNPVQIGPGEYNVGISVLEAVEVEAINHAKRYDLLGRSFEIKVEFPDTLGPASANFIHTAEWKFHERENEND